MYRRGFRTSSNPEWDLDRIMGYVDYYSKSPRWWERLYAAAMVGEVRELRTDALIHRLRADAHPVVRGKLDRVRATDD